MVLFDYVFFLARSMKDCFENGYDHNKDRDYHSIATGLAPPIAGLNFWFKTTKKTCLVSNIYFGIIF